MRAFFLKAAALAALAAATVAALLLFVRDTRSFGASSIDKRALLRAGASPRVILVGGSNAAFGVDSGRLEQGLKLPVVDAAVTYLVGLRYALASARPYVRRGDVVVIMPEYDNFYGLLDGDGTGLLSAVDDDPAGLAALSTREQVERMLASFGDVVKVLLPQRVKALARGGKTDSVYRRSSFDARGDVVAHLDRGSPGFDPKALFEGKRLDGGALEALNAFGAEASAKGARVFFAFSPLARSVYELNLEKIAPAAALVESGLAFNILDRPGDDVWPDSEFFDTYYHLGARARRAHTEALLDALGRELGVGRGLPAQARR